MIYNYINMDTSVVYATEEELIASTEERPVLPQMEAIPNMAETETLIASGYTPFTRAEAVLTHRQIQMGVSHAGKGH